MQHRYPFTVLNFEVDKEKVDVNVHPAKLEVRFSEQDSIYDQIYCSLKKAIAEHQSIPSMKIDAKPINDNILNDDIYEKNNAYVKHEIQKTEINKPVEIQKEVKKIIPEPFEYKRFEEKKASPELVAEKNDINKLQKQISLFDEDRITPEKTKNYRIIGQAFDTYFIIEMEDSLYLVDQHAAHEKVLFEKLMKSLDDHKIYSQNLMPAIVVSLTLKDVAVLLENIDVFRSFGFELEEFGGKEFKITAVPSDLYGIDVKELFIEILDNLNEPSSGEPRIISERIALRSCKAAIKGNMHMSQSEGEKLISELFKLNDPYHCPHGRPVMISLSHYELDKKFKRIV